jgi:hypothetical protein
MDVFIDYTPPLHSMDASIDLAWLFMDIFTRMIQLTKSMDASIDLSVSVIFIHKGKGGKSHKLRCSIA